MVDTCPTVLSLCSGIGMLDEAVRLVFPGAVTATCCEWEAHAASVLLARMEDQTLEPAPIWGGDLRDFNAQPFRGVVDLLIAGLPCQPYSLAGRQRGNDDARSWGEDGDGPIPQFLRIAAECRPALVFLENVPAWVVGGWFRPVGEELCRLGYDIEEPLFLAAGDVGASHQRERVFILAHLPGERGRRWGLSAAGGRQHAIDLDGERAELADAQHQPGSAEWEPEPWQRRAEGPDHGAMPRQAGCELGHPHEQREQQPHHANGTQSRGDARTCACGPSCQLAQPTRGGLGELREPSGSGGQPHGHGEAMADADAGRLPVGRTADDAGRSQPDPWLTREPVQPLASGDGLAVPAGKGCEGERCASLARSLDGNAGRNGGTPLFAPGPGDLTAWRGILGDSPHLAPAVEPGLRVLADGLALVVDASRADQLRCAGNGVVALQAAVALVELLSRVERGELT